MSETPEKKESRWQRFREPAALNYLIMAGVGLLLYFLMMSSRGSDTGAFIVILIALPGLLARWVVSPALVLIITTYLLFDPGFFGMVGLLESRRFRPLPVPIGFSFEDILLAAALLAYMIGHFRFNALTHHGMMEDPTPRRPRDPKNPPRRPLHLVKPDELPKTLVVAGACLVVGQLAWLFLATAERLSREHAFNPGQARMLMIVWAIAGALMFISAMLSYWQWRNMSRQEADMILRDTFFQEMRRETDRLQRWRKWFKNRQAMKRTGHK